MKRLLLTVFLACVGYAAFATATVSQKEWRWRNDDGNEASATWKAEVNQTPSICEDDTLRLRILFYVQYDQANPDQTARWMASHMISYSTSPGGPWTQVSTDPTGKDFVFTESKHVPGGTMTTPQIPSMYQSNPFAGGHIIDKYTTNSIEFSTGPNTNSFMEFEWVMKQTATTASGTYYFMLEGLNGEPAFNVPSIIIRKPTSSTLTETACSSYTLNGQTYTSSGTYTQVLTNAAGCDSTITLDLTINQPTSSTLTETSCGSYTLNGETYTASGTYTQVLTNAAGCDSTITLNLTINTVDVSVQMAGNVLTAQAVGAEYQWTDCSDNFAFIAGATTNEYTATASGNYSVIVTENGCKDTSECFQVIITNMMSGNSANGMNIFPAPATSYVNMEILSAGSEEAQVIIFNASGVEMSKETLMLTSGMNVKQFNVENYSRGAYLIKVILKDEVLTQKFILK